jgi:thiamine pyrophosphate-dependent acetolactate synthase large subunit-like protein
MEPSKQFAEITGAEIVVRSMIEEGVQHIFGYPGPVHLR